MYVGDQHPAAGQESDVHMQGGSGAHPHMAMMQGALQFRLFSRSSHSHRFPYLLRFLYFGGGCRMSLNA